MMHEVAGSNPGWRKLAGIFVWGKMPENEWQQPLSPHNGPFILGKLTMREIRPYI